MYKKRIISILGLIIFCLFLIQPVASWPTDGNNGMYYVQTNPDSSSPNLNTTLNLSQWKTNEETFHDQVTSLTYVSTGSSPKSLGSATSYAVNTVLVKDSKYLYILVQVTTPIPDLNKTSFGFGVGFTNSTMLTKVGVDVNKVVSGNTLTGAMLMQTEFDRKVAYYNGSNTITHDLLGCLFTPGQNCTGRRLQPGVPDTSIDFHAKAGLYNDLPYAEFKVPLIPKNATQNIEITPNSDKNTFIKIVFDPYSDIFLNGHGGAATHVLTLTFSPRCFFCQPPPGMSTLSVVFNSVFAIIVSAMAVSFLLSSRLESFGKMMPYINVNEEKAKESLIMEMAYFNSNLPSVVAMGFFTLESLIAFAYGLWAQWGITGIFINGIPLILGSVAVFDLIRRNYNPVEHPEKKKIGVPFEESKAVWILPPAFLGIVLFMLVFIGINVIST